MILSIIVAASENNVIGKDNGLIWHLPVDLRHFKTLTTGHTIVMGRRTFESIGRALPNRRNVVITRNPAFAAEGCECYTSLSEALETLKSEEEIFIIGGGTLYNALWEKAGRLYLTRVHTRVEGDTFIPEVNTAEWTEVNRTETFPDEKNEFACSFITYERRETSSR
nr:dihydrofolate reductase [uncultured Odoribacter sp.]